jgi:hypothetical protein
MMMTKMTSAQHDEISERCIEAMDGHYDQHVFDAMQYHDGASVMAKIEENAAAAAQKAKRQSRRNEDPLGMWSDFRRSALRSA